MTPLRRLTAAASALAVSLAWLVAAASGATAQGPPPPSARKVVFASPPQGASPPEGQVVSGGRPTIDVFVPFRWIPPFAEQHDVLLTLRSPGRPPVTRSKTIRVNQACMRVVFEDLPLPTNGQYDATVSSPAEEPLTPPTGDCAGATNAPRRFFMGVPPAKPTGVKAASGPAVRTVTVSWAPQPDYADVRYRVMRAKGTGPFEQAGETTRTSFSDPGSADAGDYRYQVIALRPGARPGDPMLLSDPSDEVKVTVAAPAAAPAAPGMGLPAFTAPRPSSRPAMPTPRPRYITPGETGFSQTLPFEGGSAPELAEEPGDDVAAPAPGLQEVTSSESESDSKRSLVLLASGLLATVLAMHLLWVKGEVDREPLEVLNPE